EALGSCVDIGRRLAAGASVAVDLPARTRGPDLGAGQTFVLAVVELSKQVGDLRIWEPGQLRSAASALHRARENRRELQSSKPQSKRGRPFLTARRQWQVGAPCMTAVEAPLGLAMTGEVEV